jgi:hypothetical protein
VDAHQRAQLVVALHQQRVVRTVQHQALPPRQLAEPGRVLGVDHELRESRR